MDISWLAPRTQLFDRVQRDFAFPLKDRLRIISELDKYRWKEDESVWSQKRGLTKEQYEVYFDGEFVCFFGLDDSQDQAYLRVMENILRLYKDKKIYFNPAMYEINAPKADVVPLPTANTPEEKLLREAVKRSRKKKGKRAKPAN